MITLYHAPNSRSSRIVWLLEEIGAPYAIHPVSIFRPMTGEGAGDEVNPHPDKKVPALVHDDALFAESLAIVLHLADAFPTAGLAPAPGTPAFGDYLTWMAWYAAEMEPALFASMGGELGAAPHKQRYYDQVVQRIEAALARSPYMLGNEFSAVDFLVSSALAFGRGAFPASTAIDAYIERCQTRPAAVRGAALDDVSGVQIAEAELAAA